MNSQQLQWSALKVGIVVLIGLVIFVFVVSIVGTEQNIFSSTYSLRLFMPNVRGLVNGGMVTLGGLKIGYVTDLQFARRDSVNGVDVTISILTKYHSTITTSSVAQIKTIGLLGDKYIDISIGSSSEQPLAEGAYIPLRESFDIEDAGPELKSALSDFTDLLKEMKLVASSINRAEGSVGKLIKQPTVANEVERFLKSLNRVMAAVENRQGTFGQLVFDQQMSRNLSDISANLKTVTDQLRQGKGSAGKLLMDDQLYNNLSSFSSRADSLMGKATNDSSNVSKIISDPNFYNRLNSLMQDLNSLLLDIREHPDRYVHVSVF